MAASLDGRITLPNRNKIKFASEEDFSYLQKMRCWADCIIRGSNTVSNNGSPGLTSREGVIERQFKGLNPHPLNIVLSSSLNFDFDKIPFFNLAQVKPIIFTSKYISEERLLEAKKYSEVYVVNVDKNGLINIKEVLRILSNNFNCKNILIEGGGDLNFSVLDNNLIDELHLTLCPLIIGGETSKSFVEGKGFDQKNIKFFTLKSIHKNSFDEIILKYLPKK